MDCESCIADGRHLQSAPNYKGGGCYLEGVKLDRPFPVTKGDELHGKLHHCPRSMAIAVNPWFEDFVRYDKGILPKGGGWGDQPHTYTEVMSLLHGETDRQTAETLAKLDKERQEAQRNANRKR